MHITSTQSEAAGQIVEIIASRVGRGRVAHPETAVASAARLAGSFMLSSFGLDFADGKPGDIILSVEANEKGPLLLSVLAGTLEHMGTILNTEWMKDHPAERGAESRLSFLDTLKLLRPAALEIAEAKGLVLEEIAQSSAVATAFLVRDCSDFIRAEIGFGAAEYGFIEGCKTIPPKDIKVSTVVAKPWYKLW